MYLGPLGNMQRVSPLKNVVSSPERFGGVHTSVTGRRTVDYLGARRTFEMAWKALPPEGELAWLEALYYRHVPGPLRLLLGGLNRNRLSRAASTVGFGGVDNSGVQANAGVLVNSTRWPPPEVPRGRSAHWTGAGSGDGIVFDVLQPPPVLPGETVTGSVWFYSPVQDQVGVTLTHYTPDGPGSTGAGSATVTLTPDTWTRIDVTTTPSVDAPSVDTIGVHLAAIMAEPAGSSSDVYVAAAQVEAGDAVTDWMMGGGCPLVSIGELELESPYAPVTRPTMTILEL